MMNETDVAAFEPVPTFVKPPSTHGLATGVMSIDQTSCKARKRPLVPYSSSTNYSSFNHSSRVTKANRPRGNGGSAPSSSSLAKAVVSKKRRTAAADAAAAAVTSTIAVTATTTATADEVGAFRHHYQPAAAAAAAETRWDHSFLPGPPSYDQSPDADTDIGARDHFSLSSSTLAQPLDTGLYYFPCIDEGWNNLTISSTFHPPSSFLNYDNLSPGYTLADYPPDYQDIQGITSPTFSNYAYDYSLYSSNEPVNTRAMLIQGDATSARGPLSHEPDSSVKTERELMEEGQSESGCVERRNYNLVWSDADCTGDNAREPLDQEPWVILSHPTEDDVAADKNHKSPLSDLEKEERRLRTAETRKLKACIRCRMQKIRCKPDPGNPQSQDCLTCQSINMDSKKVIHRLQCLRWKLADVVLFREGGLNLTKRWSGVKVKDLGPKDWASDRIRTIEVTIGYRRVPLELCVRKFKPNPDDVTCKHWVDRTGAKRSFDIQPYALASTKRTAEAYKTYIVGYSLPALDEYSKNLNVHEVVRWTYKAAMLYVSRYGGQHPKSVDDEMRPGNFLWNYSHLWFAIRNTLGSAFIVGNDTLDMEPIDDYECPYYQTVSAPRMIPAQFDSLGFVNVLAPKRKEMLEKLWKMMANKNPYHFFAIYLTVFMLLHEVSFTSADRLRRTRENKIEDRRYDLADFVEKLQEGANIILSHWHYYKRGVNAYIMEMEYKDKDKEPKHVVWGKLSPDEAQLLVRTRKVYEARDARNGCLGSMTWEDDLYFVSQMFEESWSPKPTYRAS